MNKIIVKLKDREQKEVESERMPKNEVDECFLCCNKKVFAKAKPMFLDGKIVLARIEKTTEYPLDYFGISEINQPWRYAKEMPGEFHEQKEPERRVKLIVTMNCSRCKRGKWCVMRASTGCEHYEPEKVYCR